MVDFERYPETTQDVLEVRYLSRSELLAESSWRVLLNGSELTWTEEDVFEPSGPAGCPAWRLGPATPWPWASW